MTAHIYYQVQARDRAGNKSELSDILNLHTTSNTLVDNKVENKVSIYPNPTSDYLTITGVSVNSAIVVYDLTGKAIMNSLVSNSPYEFSIKEMPAGMYILNITYGEKIFVDKFIKR